MLRNLFTPTLTLMALLSLSLPFILTFVEAPKLSIHLQPDISAPTKLPPTKPPLILKIYFD